MMNESVFDYENYIQMRLKEIDDLDERKFAKELLLDALGSMFACTEQKYENLKKRIAREIDMPGERFYTYTTIVDKKNYDPINGFWFPVCEEDYRYKTIYLMADKKGCREFLAQEKLEGIDEQSGQRLFFQIKNSVRYERAVKKLHGLFASNHVPWQVIHLGHLERFFDLIPEEQEREIRHEQINWQWGNWQQYIKEDVIPLWNIQKTDVHSQEFRIPCIDEIFYEHVFYLPEGQAEEDGYLVEAGEEILSARYENNRILIKTKKDTLPDVTVHRLHQKERGASFGYQYAVLSNRGKDSLAVRYLQQSGNFLQTPMELFRKIEELSGDYRIESMGYEILRQEEETHIDGLSGDMNRWVGASIFPNDQRNILLFKIRGEQHSLTDYLFEAQIRYIISQLQMEFPEYRCMAIVL